MPNRLNFFTNAKKNILNTAKGSLLTCLFGGFFYGVEKANDKAGAASMLTNGLIGTFQEGPDTAALFGCHLTAATANLLDKTLDFPAGTTLLFSCSLVTLTCFSVSKLLNTSGLSTRPIS